MTATDIIARAKRELIHQPPYDGDAFVDPKWEDAGKTHDWRNHVQGDVEDAWDSLSDDAKAVAILTAIDAAHAEEWE